MKYIIVKKYSEEDKQVFQDIADKEAVETWIEKLADWEDYIAWQETQIQQQEEDEQIMQNIAFIEDMKKWD